MNSTTTSSAPITRSTTLVANNEGFTTQKARKDGGKYILPECVEEINEDFQENKNNTGDIVGNNVTPKRKTPKERRTSIYKTKKDAKITDSDKKTFKEAFLTDKSKLDKRQPKYNREQNFIVIMKDNVHKSVHGGAGTADKFMVYGKGDIMDIFLGEGIKYDNENFYIHKNTFDFAEENNRANNIKKAAKKQKVSITEKGPRKVFTPGHPFLQNQTHEPSDNVHE